MKAIKNSMKFWKPESGSLGGVIFGLLILVLTGVAYHFFREPGAATVLLVSMAYAVISTILAIREVRRK